MLTEHEINALRERFPTLQQTTYLNTATMGLRCSDLPPQTPDAIRLSFARLLNADPTQISLLKSISTATIPDCGTRPIDITNADQYLTDTHRYLLGSPNYQLLYTKPPTPAPPSIPAFEGWPPAIDLLLTLGLQNIAAHIAYTTRYFLQGTRALGILSKTPDATPGPLVLLRSSDPVRLTTQLGEHNVIAAVAEDAVAFSFHVYNNFADVDAALAAIQANLHLLVLKA